jgi:hypothetical protein
MYQLLIIVRGRERHWMYQVFRDGVLQICIFTAFRSISLTIYRKSVIHQQLLDKPLVVVIIQCEQLMRMKQLVELIR